MDVASFAEAWIEIEITADNIIEVLVASFAEAWIEIKPRGRLSSRGYSRLLRGGVD